MGGGKEKDKTGEKAKNEGKTAKQKASTKIEKEKNREDNKSLVEGSRESIIPRIKQYLAEVRSEAGKIVWPDKKITLGTTGVVVVLVMLISFYLGIVDLVLGKMIEFILG